MNTIWFKKKGWFFIPVSFLGWAILILALGYAVYLFIEIDRNSHSVSDTLINWVFNVVIIGVIYEFVGYMMSRK